MLSDVMEDYLKTIYELQRRANGRISTSDIADHLDVTAPTVTSMLEKLAERDLVDYEKYRGVTLTGEGETVALEIIRHHRLLETYLTEHLDYDWNEVHTEADRLEHHISEKFEQRLADQLEDTSVDPHGDPIPSPDLEPLPEQSETPLSAVDAETTVTVIRIDDGDPDVLQYLADRGIRPGATLSVVEVAPFGMVTVEPSDTDDTVSLPDDVATEVQVQPVEHAPVT